jgi:hypothetical protein
VIKDLQQREVADGTAIHRCMRERLSVVHAQRAVDPDLRRSTSAVQGRLDTVPIRRPARRWREVAQGYRPELVDEDNCRPFRRCRVERDDASPLWDKIGIFAGRSESRPAPANTFQAEEATHLTSRNLDPELPCRIIPYI